MPTISGFAVVLADRVKETTGSTGTGTYSLNGAATGFQTFVAGIGNGNRCPYVVQLGSDWEVGIGTVASGAPATITRDVILASSNGGSAVNWGAGTKDIYLDVPAGWLTQIPAADIGDFAVNVAQMQTQTDPGELSSESLATDLAGELARLRFAIAEIKGTTHWYQTAGRSLAGTTSGLRTAIATTTGTEHDFTGIPSSARRITMMFNMVSLSGTDVLHLLIGDSGGIETSGYESQAASITSGALGSSTGAFRLQESNTAAGARNGIVHLVMQNASTNTWTQTGLLDGFQTSSGVKSLSGALDRVRLKSSGTNTFDGGSINIFVE